ncbi:MAG: hypothetical protein RI964_654 [Pseudomonadota bacterium]|jgi:hypothetical protein
MRHASPSILVDSDGSCDSLFRHIDAALAAGAQSLFLLACDANGFTPQHVDERLQTLPIPVFGGIFPEILAGEQKLTVGSIVCSLPMRVDVHYVQRLSAAGEDYFLQTRELTPHIPAGATLLTLVDGLSKRLSSLLDGLYEALGDSCKYLGGGAGSLSFQQKPCLFSNQGLVEDCAQITVLNLPVSIGIKHGWHKFAGPFFVTGAYDNVITTLDYRPAFEVYREVVEADCCTRFNQHNFFQLAKAYPFGLERLKGDVVVRDPLFPQDNALVCVGEVPANHIIYILKGEPRNLIYAAQQCAAQATATTQNGSFALLFDCISRTLFLEDDFAVEIDHIYSSLPDDMPLLGALSLGEIADTGNTCLEFLNKTIVLSVFSKPEATHA